MYEAAFFFVYTSQCVAVLILFIEKKDICIVVYDYSLKNIILKIRPINLE